MPTNTEIAKDFEAARIASHLGTNLAAKQEVAKQRTRQYVFFKTAADGAAATATAETAVNWQRLQAAGRVSTIHIQPTAALTGDPTNNATITVSKRDAAGANKATLGTITTTASWVAGTSVPLTLTAANLDVVEGGSVTFEISKGGTGVVVPISSVVVAVEDF